MIVLTSKLLQRCVSLFRRRASGDEDSFPLLAMASHSLWARPGSTTDQQRAAGRMLPGSHKATRRSRSEFAITETELKLIAALAIIGLSSTPGAG